MNKKHTGPIIEIKDHKGGGIDVTISCEHCGKPITKANEYGMDCENGCNEKEVKKLIGKNPFYKALFGVLKPPKRMTTKDAP